MKFFSGHEWKPGIQIESHLVSKQTFSAGPGTIIFYTTLVYDFLKKV